MKVGRKRGGSQGEHGGMKKEYKVGLGNRQSKLSSARAVGQPKGAPEAEAIVDGQAGS